MKAQPQKEKRKSIMAEFMYRVFNFVSCRSIAVILGTGLLICFSVPAGGQSIGKGMLRERKHLAEPAPQRRSAGNAKVQKKGPNKNRSPKQKAGLKKKIQEWKSLPAKKQKNLRRRMDQFKKLSPEDRRLYQKRYDQLKELSPPERRSIRKKLKKPHSLSPREKDEIRRRFRDK